MTRLVLVRAAQADIQRAALFYKRQARHLGTEFTAEIEHALSRADGNPELGSPMRRGARKLLVRRFSSTACSRTTSLCSQSGTSGVTPTSGSTASGISTTNEALQATCGEALVHREESSGRTRLNLVVRRLRWDGDNIVVGTALAQGRTLVTRNTRDFQWIPNLALLDPLT